MNATTFATVEDAFAANALPVVLYARLGGQPLAVTEVTVHHSVDRAIGTCTAICAAPRPALLELNAELEIEVGYPGASRRVFWGTVDADESITDDSGRFVRLQGRDWAHALSYPEPDGIELAGPISLKDAFRALCELREVPSYLADETTAVDGVTTIMLGGNPDIDGGNVRIDADTAPLDWLRDVSELYGYRVFGAPDGSVRLARVSGLAQRDPGATPVRFAEGENVFRIRRSRALRGMATFIEVLGARYTASDGGAVAIRAIPDVVPYDARLDPPGYVPDSVSSQAIVTDQQAQWVRNAAEVDRAAPYELLSWEFAGRADLQPGDVATLHAPNHGIEETDIWLIDIDQSVDSRGYIGRYRGWRGGGQALAAGNDCVTARVPTSGAIHAGTQTIGYYRKPSPDSHKNDDGDWVVSVPITVSNAGYSSLRLTGICHGTNSIKNRTTITGSAVEVWQLDDPSLPESGTNERNRVGSVALPTADEELSRRRDYARSDRYWQAFSLPLPGSLKGGAAELRIVCGESDGGEIDDFELDDLRLAMCGVGMPVLPGSAGDV